jgi:ankyrin repeat protein
MRELGSTPLMLALQRGHRRAARVLLDAGADRLAAHDDGRPMLSFAAEGGCADLVAALLARDADVTQPVTAAPRCLSPHSPGSSGSCSTPAQRPTLPDAGLCWPARAPRGSSRACGCCSTRGQPGSTVWDGC